MKTAKDVAFSQQTENYYVLKLELKDYKGTPRSLPHNAEIAQPIIRNMIRRDEKRLLKSYFRNWRAPYYGRLVGWRDDSPIHIVIKGKLVCGVYLCNRNEFDNDPDWGQLHYPFVDRRQKGKGLYSNVFGELVRRAKSWGLKGIYINTDRYEHPEMYERWGAVHWKVIPKTIECPKHPNSSHHNWLVHKIHDEALAKRLLKYASGILIDIGCGEKPYEILTKCIVREHIGLDYPGSLHDKESVNIFATAYETGLANDSVDTVLCTVVLEHLERPQNAINEMHRILKSGGYVLLSTPLIWHLHEEPRDFFRYTKYGLNHLFETAGFEIIEIKPLAGFIVTFTQEFVYFIDHFRRGIFKYPMILLQRSLQFVAYVLNRWDRSYKFTWAYLVVAKKP